MKILLIEDNEHKIKQITNFVTENYKECELNLRKSYNSGLRELIKSQNYSLILLDMSLPNYDIIPGESGGDFEKYAGKYLLHEMYRREINIDVLIVTMYPNYVDDEALEELKGDFPNYLGATYFDVNEPDGWRNKLKIVIDKIDHD